MTERASAYLDGGLTWRERLQVRLHLAMCRVCSDYVRQISLIAGALRRLPRGGGPGDAFLERLRAAIRTESADF